MATSNGADRGEMLLVPSSSSDQRQELQQGQPDVELARDPPSVIHVVTSREEDMTCASSVTTHFQNADLFVQHMYPSVQNLHSSDNVEHPTFDPVTQQAKPAATTPLVLPPLQEESSSQDPTNSKRTIKTSNQQFDKATIQCKEQEETSTQDFITDVPPVASLESKINQKAQVYTVQQISSKTRGDNGTDINPTVQKEQNEEEATKTIDLLGDHIPSLGENKDPPACSTDNSKRAISAGVSTAEEAATTLTSLMWIQEMPMPMNMPSSDATRRTVMQESVPGAHAVQTRSTQQSHQPITTNNNVTDDTVAGDRGGNTLPTAETLAEATLVAEDNLPVAMADDRNRYKEQNKNNWAFHVMEAIFCILVMAGIIIGAVCGTGHCSQNVYVDGSTFAPTTTRDAVAAPQIEVALKNVLGGDYFEQVEEPGVPDDSNLKNFMVETRQKAFDWIVNQDPMQMEFDAPNLVQRFVLVLFYYQTTRHKPWRECNPPAAPHASAMSGFCYEPDLHSGEITSAIWGDLWLSASHECQWAGVTCETELSEEKTVVRLGISWNGLNGPLPWEVAHLSQLTRLTLEDNVLTGVLPPALFSNQAVLHLELLVLSSNEFTGTIPLRWFDNLDEGTAKLSSLWISSNRLTGTIPSEMGLLPLKELFLENNDLTGSLPMEIFQRASGVVNEFSDGILGGIHPGKAGLDRALEYLDLSHTGISGSLPSEVGLANSLTELYASGTNMNGTLPEELYGLGNLQVLAFNGCNFTGTISSSLGVLTRLSWLHLANNNFHGTIPHEIEALTMLSQLLVNGNQFTGSVPVSFCENRFVALQDVSKVVADCLPNEETGVPTIECAADCCTSCCDNTGVCLSN